jgi:hypothetical protein
MAVANLKQGGKQMRSLKYVALLAVLMVPLAYSQAQVRVGVGVGVGVGPGYVAEAPVCAYGYYGYAPYACAPVGYYGPSWFAGGVFIGAGPWYHGYGARAGWGYGRGYYGHAGYVGRGFERGRVGGFDGRAGGGFHGAARGGFHGGGRRR